MNLSWMITPALTAFLAMPASAQQFMGMENDMGLNSALQEMLNGFGYACQNMGDPGSCNGYNYVMQVANYMVGASNACMMGDQYACQAYGGALNEITGVYMQYSMAFGGGMGTGVGTGTGMDMTGGVNPLGDTHADRMGAIAQFGADNTAAFNQRMQQMDANQAQWMANN